MHGVLYIIESFDWGLRVDPPLFRRLERLWGLGRSHAQEMRRLCRGFGVCMYARITAPEDGECANSAKATRPSSAGPFMSAKIWF